MGRRKLHENVMAASRLALLVVGVLGIHQCVWATWPETIPWPKDTVSVDGHRLIYEADVRVDTTVQVVVPARTDWWIGLGWDVPTAQPSDWSGMSTTNLGANRPSIRLECHRTLARERGRVGAQVVHFQPWAFSEEGVSDDVKGWIVSSMNSNSAPLEQVVLTPDSLAFERDTLMAPLSPGHAFRVGGQWEGRARGGWRPRVAASVVVWRPGSWMLAAPGDPSTWMAVSSEDTFQPEGAWTKRCRLECGGTLDLGESYPGSRSASQFRANVFWVPGGTWGLAMAVVVSPTRR